LDAGLIISINLSPSSLKRTDISARLGDILREHALEASQFELEITEGVLVESSEAIRR
jgi:EAL domain-containing protein (putative c-di-GMP-specific phosphodiesterase class I)